MGTHRASQLLWVVATGDQWNIIMSVAAQHGVSSTFSERAGVGLAVGYFVLFLITMQMIMLNLFTMVICEAFEVLRDAGRASTLDLVPDFRSAWAAIDPNGVGEIRRTQVRTRARAGRRARALRAAGA